MKHTGKKNYLAIFLIIALVGLISVVLSTHYKTFGTEKNKAEHTETIDAPHSDDVNNQKVTKAAGEKTAKKEPKPKNKYPKLLLYSFIHPDYLKDTAKFWGTKTGFSGFMISYVCDWNVPREKVLKRMPRLKEMNDECKKYGIDSNFIKLSMGHLKKLDWTDDKEWKKITDRVALTAKVAKETGFRGIALDTEPYYWRENSIWDYKNPLYKDKTKTEIEGLVRVRGFQLMRAIKKEYPDCEFITFPEGYFYYKYPNESVNDTAKIYNLWRPFFRGLCDAGLKNGIVVGTERTYHITRPSSIKKKVNLIQKTMKEAPTSPGYWDKKCSLALGSAPLGKSFKNKKARFSFDKFKTQIKTFSEISPRYVWVYGHGAAWWQLPKKDENKYKGTGFSYWRPYYQVLKCDKNIKKYYKWTYEVFKK